MKRRFFLIVALSIVPFLGNAAFAATNPNAAANRGAAAAPASRPAATPAANNAPRANNSSSSTANKGTATNKAAAPNRIPGYYNNATGSYYPDGYGPNNPKPAPGTSVPPTTGQYYPDRHHWRNNDYYGNYYPSYGYGPGYGYYYNNYGSPYGTSPYGLGYDGYGQPYLYPAYPTYSYAYGPPMYGAYYGNPFADASQMYRPVPILKMLGFGPSNGPNNVSGQNNGGVNSANQNIGGGNAVQSNSPLNAPANAAKTPPAPNLAAANDPANRPAPARVATVAWKFITYGDGYFGKKKYIDANERYRTASRQTNSVADAWFRQGFALAALGKYDQAAKAFHHGLEINPDWATSDFHLSDLYGTDDEEKKSKIDAIEAAAASQANDADVAFVAGVHLYFDGQPDKAAPYFRKAAQISGSDADVKGFATAK